MSPSRLFPWILVALFTLASVAPAMIPCDRAIVAQTEHVKLEQQPPGEMETRLGTGALSPNGRWLVTGEETTISVWDTATGKVVGLHVLNDTNDVSPILGFAADSSRVFLSLNNYSDHNKRILSWPLPTGEKTEVAVEVAMHALDFSPDGKCLLGGDDNVPLLISTETGKVLHRLADLGAEFRDHAFSPDSRLVFTTGGKEGVMHVERVSDGKLLLNATLGDKVTSVTFSHDGKLLFVAGKKYQSVYDLEGGTPTGYRIWHAQGLGNVTRAAFSPVNEDLALLLEGQQLRLFNPRTERTRGVLSPTRRNLVEFHFMTWSPSGEYLLLVHPFGLVTGLSAATGEPRFELNGLFDGPVSGISWQGNRIALQHHEDGTRIWDINNVTQLPALVNPGGGGDVKVSGRGLEGPVFYHVVSNLNGSFRVQVFNLRR